MDKKELIVEGIEIAAKSALSAIPVGGTLITEVWNSIKSNEVKRRLEDWQEKVEDRLSKLEISLEDISADPRFTTALVSATEMAIKVAEDQKREYLANAVKNSMSSNMEESIQLMYLDMISKYTVWHLKILVFFKNPLAFENVDAGHYYMGSPKEPLYMVYPELKKSDEIVNKIVKELYTDGLMSTENLNCTMTGSGMVASRTTGLGNGLVDFIMED